MRSKYEADNIHKAGFCEKKARGVGLSLLAGEFNDCNNRQTQAGGWGVISPMFGACRVSVKQTIQDELCNNEGSSTTCIKTSG